MLNVLYVMFPSRGIQVVRWCVMELQQASSPSQDSDVETLGPLMSTLVFHASGIG